MTNSPINVTSLMDQIKDMHDGAFLDAIIEPKEPDQYNNEIKIIQGDASSIESFKEQLNRINQLQENYDSVMKKEIEILVQIQKEYEEKGFKINIVKRKPEPEVVTASPARMHRQPEKRNKSTKLNKLLDRVKGKWDDILFEIVVEPRKLKTIEGKECNIELTDMRPYYNLYKNDKSEYRLYKTTEL